MWGGSARYQKEWSQLEVGAGVGYENFTDERVNAAGGGLGRL